MKQIIIFPRGQLTQTDRDALIDADIVAIEADDPKSVVTVLPGAPLIGADDMLMAAMFALVAEGANGERTRFVFELHKRMKAREVGEGRG
jgi:hypothetical protein